LRYGVRLRYDKFDGTCQPSAETDETDHVPSSHGTKVHIIHNDSFENDNNWLSFKMAVDFLASSDQGKDRDMLMIDGDTIVHVMIIYL
jgi:hypothetical protein